LVLDSWPPRVRTDMSMLVQQPEGQLVLTGGRD